MNFSLGTNIILLATSIVSRDRQVIHGFSFLICCLKNAQRPEWKVCPARGRSPQHSFDVFYIFSIKFHKSPPRILQIFQSESEVEICDFDRLFSFDSYLLNLSSNVTKTLTIEN